MVLVNEFVIVAMLSIAFPFLVFVVLAVVTVVVVVVVVEHSSPRSEQK